MSAFLNSVTLKIHNVYRNNATGRWTIFYNAFKQLTSLTKSQNSLQTTRKEIGKK